MKKKPAKFLSRPAAARMLAQLKRRGKKIVFTNGCFDLLHIGHLRLFKKAKTYGDILVVAINSDASLARLKGPKRPLVPERLRGELLAALDTVDCVVVFNEDTPYEILKQLKPDVLVKGGDYKIADIVGRDIVKKVVRFPVVAGHSTSSLIKTIVERYADCR
ncbi:MAG: adenylyltransferase/cytidyltransferase family protein [Elusimicrobia bacterium]|nr:adenylyltransferase/cytidyltransferase family protein [Elusimicrobiota bacterium]